MQPKLEAHSLAAAFPSMDDAAFSRLKQAMKRRGFDADFPIILYEGKILDGRNRWRAAQVVGVDPITKPFEGEDPIQYVIDVNAAARRHLTESQRAMIAAKLATLTKGRPRKNGEISPLTNAQAADLLSIDATTVKHARTVLDDGAAALGRAVEHGRIAVSAAATLARLSAEAQTAIATEPDLAKRRRLIRDGKRQAVRITRTRAKESSEPFELQSQGGGQGQSRSDPHRAGIFSVKDWEKLSASERSAIIERGLTDGRGTLNKQSGDSIEWARWSHNTVTGCLHNCPYCYARDIAERLYSYKFVPMFHPGRLAGPHNTPKPTTDDYAMGNVFANSMSDLFGQWVPVDWIGATLEMARRNPGWRFLMLTKFPQRAVKFEFPENVWIGTTVDAQARVENAEKAFAQIQCKTKWLSVEPMLEPLKFSQLHLFNWIVIGGASASKKTPAWVPPMDWVVALHRAARDAGLKIYYKTNCGMDDDLRVREFPWTQQGEKVLPKTFRYLKGM